MSILKNLSGLIVLFVLIWVIACEDDTVPDNGLISMQVASSGEATFLVMDSAKQDRVVFHNVRMAISEVTMQRIDTTSRTPENTQELVAFAGPFELILLDGTEGLSESIGEQTVINGLYHIREIKWFKLMNAEVDDSLNNRSFYIEGTIGDQPFVLWHDAEESFGVIEDKEINVNNNAVALKLNFELEHFLNGKTKVNLANAIDGNGDGLIEIHPNDPDGNSHLADQVKENMKYSVYLLE